MSYGCPQNWKGPGVYRIISNNEGASLDDRRVKVGDFIYLVSCNSEKAFISTNGNWLYTKNIEYVGPIPPKNKQENKFWVVWGGTNPPTYKHKSKDSAQKEAERLSKSNPNIDFYVLEAISRNEGVFHSEVIDLVEFLDVCKEELKDIQF